MSPARLAAAERTILIVDDSLVTREIATVALEQAGWEATSVTSGEEGVTAAAARQPDAVLLDVELPGMDGPATLAALGSGRLTSEIPVVFLTGHDDPGLLAGLVGLGAAGALTKPISVALLPGQLSALLGWGRMSGAAGETTAPLRRAGSPPPLLAHTWVRHRTMIFEQVAVVERAVSGLGGADDERLRARGAVEAHKLAGSVGTYGFDAATAQARDLERLLAAPGPLETAQRSVAAGLVAALRETLEGPPETTEAIPGLAPRVDGASSILVIDDDLVIADRLAGEAIARGLHARTASSPAEGRALAAQERPDLVLLDLTFAGGTADAYDLLAELTAEPDPVLVLVLTVRDTFVDRVEVSRRGGRGFAAKSQSVQKVLDQAVQLIERTRTEAITLLAVDDDRVVLDTVSALLRPHGIDVVALADPLLLWPELERARPDIVMLDVDMPGTSGLDLCRVLRNDHRCWPRPTC